MASNEILRPPHSRGYLPREVRPRDDIGDASGATAVRASTNLAAHVIVRSDVNAGTGRSPALQLEAPIF